MQLNDAHIFCALDQVGTEAAAALRMIRRAYEALGIRPVRFRLSLPGEGAKYVANPEMWHRANGLLSDVLDQEGLDYEKADGEAAFYGPKIDVQVADPAGRESSLSTIQVDFHQPERFGLHYIGADGGRHRPVMVHRSVIGSMERLVAHLIEVHGGAFPGWLAPVQVAILPVSDRAAGKAAECADRGRDLGLRVQVKGPDQGTLAARIRAAKMVPYQAVIGAREAAGGQLALRLRDGRRFEAQPAGQVLGRVADLVRSRTTELW
jgi:threonyl-tRNA synthetase